MMKMRIAIALLSALSLILSTLPRTSAQQPRRDFKIGVKADITVWPSRSKRWAVIIGVDQYESRRINPLFGAVNDAHRLAEALVKYAGFPPDQVIVLATDQMDELKPKRGIILETLAKLNGNVPADGLLLFAFSGHGVDVENRVFLLPCDARSADPDARLLRQTAVSFEDVKDEIARIGVRQVVALLDSCRSDPRAGTKGDSDNVMPSNYDFEFRNQSVEGFITFYATSKGLRAYEDVINKQGYFSLAFIEGLRGAAANERGEVTLERLAKYLEAEVPKRVEKGLGRSRRQIPRMAMDGYGAERLVLSIAALLLPPQPVDLNAGEDA